MGGMAISPIKVANFYLTSQEVGVLWDNAVNEVRQFNEVLALIERKPSDLTTARKGVRLVNKSFDLRIWVGKVFSKDMDGWFVSAWRRVTRLSKDAGVEEIVEALRQFREVVQEILSRTAPAHFTHLGFKFDNPDHMPWETCRVVFDGVDFLKKMFQKRGVLSILEQGVRRVVLVPTGEGIATFNSRSHELTIFASNLLRSGRFSDSFAGEALIHEFGHFVHRSYITGEAAAAWDAPWKDIPSTASPEHWNLRSNPDRLRKLEPLDIVTDYGKTDKYEDFAETFLLFMVAPERLSQTARFRMQQALSLSGLYGKPVVQRLGVQNANRQT